MRSLKKTAEIVCVALLCLGGVFTGCSKDSGDTIKIGGIFPLSGEVAVYGTECRNGIMLAIDEINAAGGVNGKQLELVGEDDEGSPEKSVNVYKKLVTKDNCDVIIGIGGGSAIDSAKAISVMATNPGDYWDYIEGGTGLNKPLINKPLPVIAITTTSGTGTESDPWTVITNGEEKIGYGNDLTFPYLSIVDPMLTLSIPKTSLI